MNNYGLRKIVITVAVLAVVSLGVAGVISATSGIFSKRGILGSANAINVDEQMTYSVAGVDSIRAFSTSADINFLDGGADEIRFHLHGAVRTANENRITKLVERKTGRSLEVGAEPPKGAVGMFSSTLKLDVYLPESYRGDLDVHSVSGDLSLPFGMYDTLTMRTTSGEIDFSDITSQALKTDSTSGDITGAATVNGPIDAKTTSGEIDIRGSAASVTADSTSGDITFDLESISGNVHVEATSGEVKLTLPKDFEFDMTLRATSGDIASQFPVIIQGTQGGPGNKRLEGTVGNGGPQVEVKTVSGDIAIRQR